MNSLWTETCKLPAFPRLEHDLKTDVLIIGGGMAGILCAHFLAQAGINHTLVEADRICCGVSGGTTAKITAQHGLIFHKLLRSFGAERTHMYLQANLDAVEQFRQLCANTPCDFQTKGNYVYCPEPSSLLEQELSALEQLGYSARFVTDLPLPISTAGAVCFPDQGQFHPLKFAAGLLSGLNIYEHTPVRTFDGRRFCTDRGKITAEKVIVATHFPIFNKHGAYFLKMYQHRSYVLALSNAPELNGMYVDNHPKGMSFRTHNGLLLLGGGDHRTGKQGGNWQELTSFVRTHYPHAQEKYRWAAQDCISLDSVPYIGQYAKGTPNVYVATGFNKWGMTASMVAAGLLRDLVLDRANPLTQVFSPSRSMLSPQLGLNALESTLNLLTPTTPRCPHLGCALKWNAAEHSWDCPCHGSRFGQDGSLLTGPATGNLKRK